jgi:hypothetical protein
MLDKLYEGIGWSDTEAYAGVLQGRTIRKGVPEHNFFLHARGRAFFRREGDVTVLESRHVTTTLS